MRASVPAVRARSGAVLRCKIRGSLQQGLVSGPDMSDYRGSGASMEEDLDEGLMIGLELKGATAGEERASVSMGGAGRQVKSTRNPPLRVVARSCAERLRVDTVEHAAAHAF